MDLAQTVLAAFQAEHRTQLEGIRALLSLVRSGGTPPADRLDEAYRLAHSLKGGARACGLERVETLGHRLEAVFARIRTGDLALDATAVSAMGRALDAVEDVMAAVEAGQPMPDVAAAVQALGGLAAEACARERHAAAPRATSQALLEAFGRECRQHLARVRKLGAGAYSASDLAEAEAALRSVRTAAEIIDAPQVLGVLAERLESLIGGVRAGVHPWRDEVAVLVASGSDSIERLAEGRAPPEATRVLQDVEAALRVPGAEAAPHTPVTEGTPRAPSAEAAPSVAAADAACSPSTPAGSQEDTIWLRARGLEDLLLSADRLEVEAGARLARLGAGIGELHAGLAELHHAWAAVREHSAREIGMLHAAPEYRRIARFLELAERQLHRFARRGRDVSTRYRRHAWSLRSLVGKLHRDARAARMVSAQSVYGGLRKMVRDLLRDCGKEAEVELSGLAVQADRLVLQGLKDPLLHLLRNAVVHGIEAPDERRAAGKSETGRITLALEASGDQLTVRVADDGRGLDQVRLLEAARRAGHAVDPGAAARLALEPGVSTVGRADRLSGRGMGLSVVREAVKRLQGSIELDTRDVGFAVTMVVPVSVASQRLLLVSDQRVTYGVPAHAIERLLRVRAQALATMEGAPVVELLGEPVPLVFLSALLGRPDAEPTTRGGFLSVMVVQADGRRLGVAVDAFVAQRDVVTRGLAGPVVMPPIVAGAVVCDDGSVGLVLDPGEMVAQSSRVGRPSTIREAVAEDQRAASTILVVDDSFTTRTLEKSMLEAHGYDVRLAVDGLEAWTLLQSESVDLVVSDIQMPALDGFGLLERIRRHPRLKELPVIMVTSVHEPEHRERGLALGANAYVTKQRFDHEELLGLIRRLV
jgi:two-component system, chemotaxis family, sensor kinase CheA